MNSFSNFIFAFSKFSRSSFNSFRIGCRYCSTEASPNKGGLFGLGTIQKPKDFRTLTDHVHEKGRVLLAEALAGPQRKRKVVAILDELSDTICQAADMAECIRMVHPIGSYATEAEYCVGALSQFVESLNSNRDVYTLLRRSVETNDGNLMDDVDRRVATMLLDDMESSGIHLSDSLRYRFIEYQSNIFAVGSEFVHAAHEYKALRNLRTAATEAFVNRQKGRLKKLLTLRHRLALLTGYQSYAERAMKGSFLETPSSATDFLKILVGELKSKRPNDVASSTAATSLPTKSDGGKSDSESEDADVAVLSLSHLINDKINPLAERLVGLRFERRPPETDELWHPSVTKLVAYCVESPRRALGTVYCDWFDRERKCGEAHFTVRCGRDLRGVETIGAKGDSYQSPIMVLSFRLATPLSTEQSDFWSSSVALTGTQVETILHEFGHALHTLVGRTRYQHVSGTRCSTDLAEIPSTFMEHFILDDRAARPFWGSAFDRHRTKSRRNATNEMLNQCALALTDLRLHSVDPQQKTADEVCASISQELGLEVSSQEQLLAFEHMVSYGAKYHSYIVARAMAALLWRKGGFVANAFDSESASIFRRLLSYGGEKYPREMLDLTIGQVPSVEALAKSLAEDVVGEGAAMVMWSLVS